MTERRKAFLSVNDYNAVHATWLSASHYLRRYDQWYFPVQKLLFNGHEPKLEVAVVAQTKCFLPSINGIIKGTSSGPPQYPS